MKINRQLIFRVTAILLILILCVILFHVGKQHSILIDNKTITVNEQELKSLNLLEVKIDNYEELEMYKNDRLQQNVVAQKHTLTVTYTDKQFNEIVLTRKFRVPLNIRMLIISIPSFIENPDNQELWIEPFEIEISVPEEEVEVVDDGLSIIPTTF